MDARERRSDRIRFLAIGGEFTFGLALLLTGALAPKFQGSVPRREDLGVAVIPGIIFIGLAVHELIQRLRHGPQRRGRHQR